MSFIKNLMLRNIGRVLVAVVMFVVLVVIFSKTLEIKSPTTDERTKATTTPPVSELVKMKPLLPLDEVSLQKQLQGILVKGSISDCVSLSDPRYQFACRDFFKNKKK